MRSSEEIQKDLDKAKEDMRYLLRHKPKQDYVYKDTIYESNKLSKHIHNLEIKLNQAKQREFMSRKEQE